MALFVGNPHGSWHAMEIDRLNNMFADFYGRRSPGLGASGGHLRDRSTKYVIKAELPEMKREDISVTFENSVLTLKGERTVRAGARPRTSTGWSADGTFSGRSRCRTPWTAAASARPTRTAC